MSVSIDWTDQLMDLGGHDCPLLCVRPPVAADPVYLAVCGVLTEGGPLPLWFPPHPCIRKDAVVRQSYTLGEQPPAVPAPPDVSEAPAPLLRRTADGVTGEVPSDLAEVIHEALAAGLSEEVLLQVLHMARDTWLERLDGEG